MKTLWGKLMVIGAGLLLSGVVHAQFIFTTNNGAITIVAYGGPGGNVTIPSATNGYPVTGVDHDAFFSKWNLTGVIIPDSITNIGGYAFYNCKALTNVTIGNSVTIIGDSAFNSCFGLTSVVIPDSVNSIGNYTFGFCSGLTNVTIGKGVTSIGNSAFYYCFPLASVTIPSRVTSIGDWAFLYCTNLTSVTIPNGVTNIGNHAFAYCANLHQAYFQGNAPMVNGETGSADSTVFTNESGTVYYQPNTTGWGATFGGWPTANLNYSATNFVYITNNGAITITGFVGAGGNVDIPIGINGYPVTAIGTNAFINKTIVTGVIIPDSVTSIGGNAFTFCSSLTNVTLGNGVTSIGFQAFAGCGLTSVTIPISVTNIGGGPFNGCSGLTNIAVNAGNTSYTIVGGVLFNQSMTLLVQFPAGLAGSYVIPNNVTNIGVSAFGGSRGLTNVTFGNGVTSISDFAFTSVGLTSVTIPASVTNLGSFAFASSSGLLRAYFQGNAPSVNGVAGSEISNVFMFSGAGKVYCLPNTTGWGATFGNWPTVLWNPQMQTTNGSFGVKTNQFGFNLTGTTSIPVVVEACTNMGGAWTTLFSGSVTNGSIYFSDPQWTNYPNRFYRVRSP